jgi:hypothetical protein
MPTLRSGLMSHVLNTLDKSAGEGEHQKHRVHHWDTRVQRNPPNGKNYIFVWPPRISSLNVGLMNASASPISTS